MDARRGAPVFVEDSIEVNATPERVWAVMAAIDSWPAWNPAVTSAELEGELRPGTVFRWKAGKASITSTLTVVDPPREISWTGKTAAVTAIHVWRIEPRGGWSTVRTEESWEGVLVKVFRKMSRRSLEGALRAGLEHLKTAAETPPSPGRMG